MSIWQGIYYQKLYNNLYGWKNVRWKIAWEIFGSIHALEFTNNGYALITMIGDIADIVWHRRDWKSGRAPLLQTEKYIANTLAKAEGRRRFLWGPRWPCPSFNIFSFYLFRMLIFQSFWIGKKWTRILVTNIRYSSEENRPILISAVATIFWQPCSACTHRHSWPLFIYSTISMSVGNPMIKSDVKVNYISNFIFYILSL